MSFERPPMPATKEFDPEKAKISEIPERELEFSYAHSSGKGGQSVNTSDSKVNLKWPVMRSEAFTPEQRQRILERVPPSHTNQDGCVIVSAQEGRTQLQNKRRAIKILRELVTEALQEDPERIPTKPTRGSKERRMDNKTHLSRKKKGRRQGDWD